MKIDIFQSIKLLMDVTIIIHVMIGHYGPSKNYLIHWEFLKEYLTQYCLYIIFSHGCVAEGR